MALSFLYLAFTRILQLVRLSRRDSDELATDIVMLRHEVAGLRRQVVRLALRPTDRALLAGLGRLLDRRRRGRFFVQPVTLLRWHRDLIRRTWIYAHHPGRPSIPAGTVTIILRLARENPTWGYRRIEGEPGPDGRRPGTVERLGHPAPPRHRSLADAGRPDLERVPLLPGVIAAGLRLLHRRHGAAEAALRMLCFIGLDTRRVYVTGVTARPTGTWVVQRARNLTMAVAEGARPFKFLMRDRDAKFTSSFDEVFRAGGARIIRTPVRAPRANAYAERFVGTVRRECLDRMLTFGRRHLERVLAEYIAHYNDHRPHRALGQPAPLAVDSPPPASDPVPTQLRRNNAVFGLINEYRPVA
jgi:transposase InsO family protein